ncbi:hypothetical protein G9A89_018296 [Geosiphon pyriformis]|nr:hypothetical protein G9A89_018296 [Geosiphon pyriformis]
MDRSSNVAIEEATVALIENRSIPNSIKSLKLQLKKNSSLQSTVNPLQPVLQSLFRLQKVILENQNQEIVLPYPCSFLTECEVYGICKWDANQFDVKLNDLISYVQLQRIVVFRLYGHKRENFKII